MPLRGLTTPKSRREQINRGGNRFLPRREIIDNPQDALEQLEAIHLRLGDRFGLTGLRFELVQSAKIVQVQGDPMPIVTAVVLSMFLLIVTGCAASGPPSPTKQATGKRDSTLKPANHDEEKSMNEESQNAIMNR